MIVTIDLSPVEPELQVVGSTPTLEPAYYFKRTETVSALPGFNLDVEIDGINSKRKITVIDPDGREYVVPYNVALFLKEALPNVSSPIKSSKTAYKIRYALMEERFGLYRISELSSEFFEDSTEQDPQLKSIPLLYSDESRDFSYASQRKKDNYFVIQFKDSKDGKSKSVWQLYHIRYPEQIILSCPWDDLEKIAEAVELLKDVDASQSLFVLSHPSCAGALAAETTLLREGATVIEKMKAWSGVEEGDKVDGYPLNVTRVSNRAIGKALRDDAYQNLIDYDCRGENFITTLNIGSNADLKNTPSNVKINLGVILHVATKAFNNSYKESTFIHRLKTYGDFADSTIFDTQQSESILGKGKGNLIIIMPNAIADEIGQGVYKLQNFLQIYGTDSRRVWF